ncbi:MAG: hypothetical protein K2N14_02050 [Clostridia bacterium]|nr:hypothetical protein [Clostridia bacterium]
MKKILVVALSSLLAISGAAAFSGCKPQEKKPAQDNLYFVPGTYFSDGVKVENGLPSGAEKLSAEACAEMNTENVYKCKLPAGANLPVPTSERKDKDDNLYSFNGWWTIVNATVTYYKTVPAVTETTYLYADWRADLSQRKDPIIPDNWVETEPDHYLLVNHKDAAEPEKMAMRFKFTDMPTAETLGYFGPVELYIQGMQLLPGDKFTVYSTGLSDAETAIECPYDKKGGDRSILLEASGDKDNDTKDYLSAKSTLYSQYDDATISYTGEKAAYYNIYIKFYSGGSVMSIYLEPMEG